MIRVPSRGFDPAIGIAATALLMAISQAWGQPSTELDVPGFLRATNTHFEVAGDSLYLSADASDTLSAEIILAGTHVTMFLNGVGDAGLTEMSVSAFPPNTTVYLTMDPLEEAQPIQVDGSGDIALSLDLSGSYMVQIQRWHNTIHLTPTGWSDPSVGTWDPATQTGTLTRDVTDQIYIEGNNLTLEGAGYSCTYNGSGAAVTIGGRTGVTVRNLVVLSYYTAISIGNSPATTIKDCYLRTRSGLAFVGGSNGGPWTPGSCSITATGNTIRSPTGYGFYMTKGFFAGFSFGARENTVIAPSPVFLGSPTNSAGGASIYNNNFYAPNLPALYGWNVGWSSAPPIGGNYWSVWDTPDNDLDGFVDFPLVLTRGQDSWPYAAPQAWGLGPFTIVATAGPGGVITPSGSLSIEPGEDQTFTITPLAGYDLEDVLVDGNSVGPATTHSFVEVVANHTISATFASRNQPPVLAVIDDQATGEEALFSLIVSASDPDTPPQPLTFSLLEAPAGMVIDSSSGLLTWIPDEADGPGDYPVTVSVSDNQIPPFTDSQAFNIHVDEVNVAPIPAAISDRTIDEEQTLVVAVAASDHDLPPNNLTFSFVTAPPAATIDAWTGEIRWTPEEADGPGDYTIRVRVSDDGVPPLSDEREFNVHVDEVNIPPALSVPGPVTVDEGSLVTFTADATDPDVPANVLTFGLATPSPAGATIDPVTGAFHWLTVDDGDFVVRVSVDDGAGGVTQADVPVTAHNVAPTVTITSPPSGALYVVDAPVTFTGAFTDPGTADTHTAAWQIDATAVAGVVDPTARTVSGTHTFTIAGVYMVRLTVTDDDGGEGYATQVDSLDAMIVVYDPEAGFVTGGGWIQSPPGAYVADSTLTGKANFGFVSKYKKGAPEPTGETEFQFRTASLSFHSTQYEWLVIAGAKAQYKGSGIINGSGDFGFILTAVDGDQLGNGQPDTFRMKITDKATGLIVYDNKLGAPDSDDPTTILGGGSIVIHKPKTDRMDNSSPTQASADALLETTPTTWRLGQNAPNPFRSRTTIQFDAPQPATVQLVIFDAVGRVVRRLMDEERGSGRHEVTWNGVSDEGLRVASGVYFASIVMNPAAGGAPYRAIRKVVVLR